MVHAIKIALSKLQEFLFLLYKLFCYRTKLLTCSWHQKTKPLIPQFTNLMCCKKARVHLKSVLNRALFLIYYFKKHFKPCFFILKVFKDILQHFKFLNWWIRGFVFLMKFYLVKSCLYLWLVIKSGIKLWYFNWNAQPQIHN